MSHRDKALPRIHNSSQNKKTPPKIRNTSQNPKTRSRIQNTSQNPKNVPESKTLPRIQKCFWEVLGFLSVFLVFGTCFGLLQGFLDSRIEVFWILGSVSDAGTCFGFWEVFLDSGRVLNSGRVFGIWEVFRILWRVFGFWDVLWTLESVFGFWDVFFPYEPPYVCDWLKKIFFAVWSVRSTTQILVVARHRYGIPALVPQRSCAGKPCGGVAKRRLHSQSRSDHWFKLMGFYFFLEYS